MLSGRAGQDWRDGETQARLTILGFLILHFGEFAAWCESESVALAIVEQLKKREE